MLLILWKNDWPIILEKNKEVPMILNLPSGVTKKTDDHYMASGNFSFCDSFKDDSLAMAWLFVRTPLEKWYDIDTDGGIWIRPRQVNLRERKQPSFIARRQQHHTMSVETKMTFIPTNTSQFAGLSLFQNEAFHISLGLTMVKSEYVIRLQKADGQEEDAQKVILEQQVLPATFDGNIELKSTCDSTGFSFYYKLPKQEWTLLLSGMDAAYLSTERAHGFIGTVIGLYASSNE